MSSYLLLIFPKLSDGIRHLSMAPGSSLLHQFLGTLISPGFSSPIIPSQPSGSGCFLYCLLMSIFPAVLPPVLFPLCRPKPLTYHPDADNFLITWVHFFPRPRLTCLCEHSTYGNANARYAKMNPLSLRTCSSSCIPCLGKRTHPPSRPSSYTYMSSPAPPSLLHKFDVKVC